MISAFVGYGVNEFSPFENELSAFHAKVNHLTINPCVAKELRCKTVGITIAMNATSREESG